MAQHRKSAWSSNTRSVWSSQMAPLQLGETVLQLVSGQVVLQPAQEGQLGGMAKAARQLEFHEEADGLPVGGVGLRPKCLCVHGCSLAVNGRRRQSRPAGQGPRASGPWLVAGAKWRATPCGVRSLWVNRWRVVSPSIHLSTAGSARARISQAPAPPLVSGSQTTRPSAVAPSSSAWCACRRHSRSCTRHQASSAESTSAATPQRGWLAALDPPSCKAWPGGRRAGGPWTQGRNVQPWPWRNSSTVTECPGIARMPSGAN